MCRLHRYVKKLVLVGVILSITITLSACRKVAEEPKEEIESVDSTYKSNEEHISDYGIFTSDNKLLLSYNELQAKYNVDITKNINSDTKNTIQTAIDDLGVNNVKIKLPEVDRLGNYQLAYIDKVDVVVISDNTTEIGEYAFYNSSIQKIAIPSSVVTICNNAFDSCKDLSYIIFNEGLQTIGVSAFRYTNGLEHIELPNSLKNIQACAFQDTGMTYINVPNTVEFMDDTAFIGVDTICYNGVVSSSCNFGAGGNHVIYQNKCELCNEEIKTTEYIIQEPEFISENGVCEIPEYFTVDDIEYKVVAIEDGAYKGNKDIRQLLLPESVVRIGDEAFADCSNLQNIQFNNTLESLGNYTFLNCTALTKVEITDNIIELHNSFNGCSSLKELVLHKNIILDSNDFNNCENIETVYFNGTIDEWNSIYVMAPAPIMQTTIDKVFDKNINIIAEK